MKSSRRPRLAALVAAGLLPLTAAGAAVADAPNPGEGGREKVGARAVHAPAPPSSVGAEKKHQPRHRNGGVPPERVWLKDVRKALADVPAYLDDRAEEGGQLAIVLGIDNVALATYYDWPKVVRPTLRVARRAQRLGMAVFFVTGRFTDDVPSMRRLLRQAGFSWQGICARDHGVGVAAGKTRCRRQITERGFTVTANIASHDEAFHGGYYERAVMLPNYDGRLL